MRTAAVLALLTTVAVVAVAAKRRADGVPVLPPPRRNITAVLAPLTNPITGVVNQWVPVPPGAPGSRAFSWAELQAENARLLASGGARNFQNALNGAQVGGGLGGAVGGFAGSFVGTPLLGALTGVVTGATGAVVGGSAGLTLSQFDEMRKAVLRR